MWEGGREGGGWGREKRSWVGGRKKRERSFQTKLQTSIQRNTVYFKWVFGDLCPCSWARNYFGTAHRACVCDTVKWARNDFGTAHPEQLPLLWQGSQHHLLLDMRQLTRLALHNLGMRWRMHPSSRPVLGIHHRPTHIAGSSSAASAAM